MGTKQKADKSADFRNKILCGLLTGVRYFPYLQKRSEPRLLLESGLAEGGRRPTLPLCAVPSAPKGLTSVFGMGTGGSPSL